jgi:hypothetical protein
MERAAEHHRRAPLCWLQLQHHDKASLLAGKLHAILQRPYTKGWDFYALLWYLGGLAPAEPGFAQQRPGANRVEWHTVQADVSPFVEPGVDLILLCLGSLERVLGE